MQKENKLLKYFKTSYINSKFDLLKKNRRVNYNSDFNNLNHEKIK